MPEIRVKFAGIEKSPDGKFSIVYIPDQTQVLQAGQKYRIVIEGLTYERWEGKRQESIPPLDAVSPSVKREGFGKASI